MTAGWLGTGKMGTALAHRLLDAGTELAVWNRTASKTAPLTERGARLVDAPAELCAQQAVFITVGGDTDLIEVLSGENGLLDADQAPQVIIDCSTVSPETSAQARELATAAGSNFIAAPISGNPSVVEAGNAAVVASGPRDVFDTVLPLLDILAGTVTWVGAAEHARLVKICHNLYLGMLAEALVEVTSLAEHSGVDRAAFLDFLSSSVLGSPWISVRAEALAQRDLAPTFTLDMLRKDLDLGLDAAGRLGVPLPSAAIVEQLATVTAGLGHGSADMLALTQLQPKGHHHA